MNEFVPPHGRFSHWTDHEKRELFSPAIEVIHKRTLCGFAATVIAEDYTAATYGIQTKALKHVVGTPYGQCFLNCLSLMGKWATENGYRDEIAVIGDSGNEGRTWMDETFRILRSTPEIQSQLHLGTLDFRPDNEVTALQAADFLHMRRTRNSTDCSAAGSAEPCAAHAGRSFVKQISSSSWKGQR